MTPTAFDECASLEARRTILGRSDIVTVHVDQPHPRDMFSQRVRADEAHGVIHQHLSGAVVDEDALLLATNGSRVLPSIFCGEPRIHEELEATEDPRQPD